MKQLNNISNFTTTRRNHKEEEHFKMDIDSETVGGLLDLTLDTYNTYSTKKFHRSLRKLLQILDKSVFSERPDDLMMLDVMDVVLSCYLDKDMATPSVIIQEVYDELPHYRKTMKDYFGEVIDSYYEEDVILDEDVSKYLCKYVEDRLIYYNMFKCRELLQPLFDKLDDSSNLSMLNKNYTQIIQKAYADNLKCKLQEEHSMNDFSSSDENSVDTILGKTIEEYQRPNNRIKMGIKRFNDMLGGGLENGRFYLACGLPKNFKSGILLNILVWACKYNKFELKGEDEEKMPTIFLLTMENSTRETINRLYLILTGKSIDHYTLKEAKRILNDEFTNKYGINIEIKYRPNKTINTLDFDDMISDIESEGTKKVVLAIQDYTKRIRSANPDKELRLELGNVSDDFCTIAKKRNIPILSAAQLNRQAMQKVEELRGKGTSDIGKYLTSSYIGESAMLIENADCSFTIFKEKGGYVETDKNLSDDEADYWLSFRLLASREQTSEISYFAQKFENGMKIQEDFDLNKSLSITSIGEINANEFNPTRARKEALKKAGNLDVDDEDTFDPHYDPNEDDEDIEFDDEKPKKKRKTKKKSNSVSNKRKTARSGKTSKKIEADEEELLEEDSDEFDVEE